MLICQKGTGSTTRGYIHPGDPVFDAADRIAGCAVQDADTF
jgi:hypothetical protein